MKRFLIFVLALAVAAGCGPRAARLQTGDLVFVGLPMDYDATGSAGSGSAEAGSGSSAEASEAGGSMAEAIAAATGEPGELNLIHVAIAEVAEDGVWIIDATIRHGVDRHPLDTFLRDFTLLDGSLPEFVVKRVSGADPEAAVQRAKAFCGRAYDKWFLPDNEELYCTELVQRCFLDSAGEPVFESAPMNFCASDGTMPPYWEWLFGLLGMEVPQGLPGTNPQNMAKALCLSEVAVTLGE